MNMCHLLARVLVVALIGLTTLHAAPLAGWKSDAGPANLKFREDLADKNTLTLISREKTPGTAYLVIEASQLAGARILGEALLPNIGMRIRFSADSGADPQVIGDLAMKPDWQPIDMTLPANLKKGNVRLFLHAIGEGSLTVRNLRLETAPSKTPAASILPARPASTGSAGNGLRAGPFAWHFRDGVLAADAGWSSWVGEGKISNAFDLTMVHEGSKSMRLQSDGVHSYGMISGIISNLAPHMLFKGYARSKGELVESLIAIQFFDSNWQKVSWLTLGEVPVTDTWTLIEAPIETPADAVHAALTMGIKGQGVLWLDEPEVTVTP